MTCRGVFLTFLLHKLNVPTCWQLTLQSKETAALEVHTLSIADIYKLQYSIYVLYTFISSTEFLYL